MFNIEDIRKRFTIYDFIIWSTLICFGIIIAMINHTNPDTHKCILYNDESIDVLCEEYIHKTNKTNKTKEKSYDK
jgi:hypothetical protein